MGWLETWGDAVNRVDDGEDSDMETLTVTADAPDDPGEDPITGAWTYIRTRTTKRYRYVGMTLETAKACRDTKLDVPDVIAHIAREGDGGNFAVSVSEVSYSEWELI